MPKLLEYDSGDLSSARGLILWRYNMDDSDIVEIYSAAISIEAYAMANALKAAGVKARVANEFVQMGLG